MATTHQDGGQFAGSGSVDVSDDGPRGLVPDGYIAAPTIRSVPLSVVAQVLNRGWADVRQSWAYGLFFGGFYVVGGLGVLALALWTGNQQAMFPLVAGFLLIGPITAVGLYDVSRRLERGRPLAPKPVLLSFRRHGGTQLMLFGASLVFVMMVWLLAARLVYALAFGLQPMSVGQLVAQAVQSPRVALFLVAGNLIGALLAFGVYAMSVVAVPLLLDRDIDFMTAMTTSIAAVRANPVPMLAFAVAIGMAMLVGVLTGFLALLVLLPLVGHATWHLYRAVIVPADPDRC